MARVTIHNTPGGHDGAVPEGHFQVMLEDGRRITSKPVLNVREEMALSEHIGADTRLNPVWVLWATIACCVTHIDDEPVRRPVTKLQVEALIDRIGDEAMRVLLVRYRRNSEERESRTLERAKN